MDTILSRFRNLPSISEIIDELVLMETEYSAMGDSFNSSSARRAFGTLKKWAAEYRTNQIEYQQALKILEGLPDRIVANRLRSLIESIATPVSPITRVDADRISFPSASGRRNIFEFASQEDCTCEWRRFSRVKRPGDYCWHILAVNAICRKLVAKQAQIEASK